MRFVAITVSLVSLCLGTFGLALANSPHSFGYGVLDLSRYVLGRRVAAIAVVVAVLGIAAMRWDRSARRAATILGVTALVLAAYAWLQFWGEPVS